MFDKKLVNRAWQMMQQASTVTFLTHRNPDADGISACAALSTMLEKMGKKVESVYPTKDDVGLKRQPKNVHVNKHTQVPDLLIMCDTATIDRLYFPEEFKDIPSINIDHHISNSIKATVNFIRCDLSSTCEAVYFLIQEWNPKIIDKYVAETLLIGILYDCQTFHTQSTYSSTLRVAADLMDAGANLFNMHSEVLYNKEPKIISLWGKLLSNITFSPKNNAAWSCVRQKDLQELGVTLTSLIGFSNFLAQLSGIDVTVLFYENEHGQTKVSLRSKKTDVNAIASQFGGGGHKNASGILSELPFDQIVQSVTTLLSD